MQSLAYPRTFAQLRSVPCALRIIANSRIARAYTSKLLTVSPALPELFPQTIVLSNGATYTVRTTSPRSQIRLTRDTRNHPLWNPSKVRANLKDESEQLVKFTKRFSDLEDLTDVSFIKSEENVSAAMKKAVANSTAQKRKTKGKK
ncbi:hypothetical protein BC937DRAFT_91322 [Endogone sp. FLAS-F59071]|nr:hypothetical protein BC937DRAFT_91322 [Endogone sp. FLAS-F59071]|eukprot:RUS21841.1 hypothetical protein BC937DRAFT_91322 [Endogone sp. FLAS-F59071]